MSETDFKVATDTQGKLTERVTHSSIRKKSRDSLDVQPVVVVDPNTGELQGFFPTIIEIDWTSPAAAVQNAWYTVFEGYNVKVLEIACGITVADETVEIRVTIDGLGTVIPAAGVACTFAANPVTPLNALRTNAGNIRLTQGAAQANCDLTYSSALAWVQGRHVKIEARKTTNAGASFLRAIGFYHQY